jgi:hypothetical protein
MSKPKLSLQERSIVDKIQFGRQIVTSMTGNANFTDPSPALAEVTTATDQLESSYNAAIEARNASQQATATQNADEEAFDKELTQLSAYVGNASDGDEQKILSAGMPVRDTTSQPIGALPAPDNLHAAAGDMSGTVDLNWEPVHGAASYMIQQATQGDPMDWGGANVATKSSATISGLTPGEQIWFRVAAIGSAGQGPWSNPAAARAKG